MSQAHPHWVIVNFESFEQDPGDYLRAEYDGLLLHIQIRRDEYCNLISAYVEPPVTDDEVRLKINRFLSAMSWKDGRAFITRGSSSAGSRDKNKPAFNYHEKRHYPYPVISPYDFEHLQAPPDDKQKLALEYLTE